MMRMSNQAFRSLFIAILAAGSAIVTPAKAAEIRVCEREIRSAPLNDQRSVHLALLQAIAVINSQSEPIMIEEIRVDTEREGMAVESLVLNSTDLEDAIHNRGQIAAVEQIFPAQLCNGKLLKGASLAEGRLLAPGEGVVITYVPIVWKGAREFLSITASTRFASGNTSDRFSLPIRQRTSDTLLLYPVAGRTYVGVAASLHSPHRWAAIEEFALDIVALGKNGATFSGTGQQLGDYAAFGLPVRAAAGGTIIAAHDGSPDTTMQIRRPDETASEYLEKVQQEQLALISQGLDAILGNHVVLDHGNGEFSVYAHLKNGSILYPVGERLEAGQVFAAIGNSGNSTEPHLHFQICDDPQIEVCRTIPPSFKGYVIVGEFGPRSIQSGDIVETIE